LVHHLNVTESHVTMSQYMHNVVKALGYADQQKAIKMHVDNEDKLTRQIVVSGQKRNIIFI